MNSLVCDVFQGSVLEALPRTLAHPPSDVLQLLRLPPALASPPKGTIENILDNDPRDLIGDFSKVTQPLAVTQADGLPPPPPL